MAKFWWFALILNAVFLFACAESDVSSGLEYENQKCTAELNTCSLIVDGEPLKIRTLGEKGDKGPRGEKGERGLIGPPGTDGPAGPDGRSGTDGIQGPKGERGDPGPMGDSGPKGDKGDMGPIGFSGLPGSKGDSGEKGEPGPKGPPGLPGLPGSCPCLPITKSTGKVDAKGLELTGIDTEAVVCKNLDPIREGVVTMGPGSMNNTCVREVSEDYGDKIWTCIPPKERKNVTEKHVLESKQYWLSSKQVTLLDIYGLTHTQLDWIQTQSTSAFQKIRYYCKNSMLYDNTTEEDVSSLLMLSWNDIIFGPKPMETTPFVYEPILEPNDCMSPPTGEVRSSVIEIKSDSARRLPVTDFLVRDLRDSFTDIGVEHLELCFF